MGYASFLEDIVDRYNDELLRPAESLLNDPAVLSSREVHKRHEAFVRVCRQIEADLRRHFELATDPEVELAHKVIELERENATLRDEVRNLEDKLQNQEKEANSYVGENAALRFKLIEEKQRLTETRGILDDVSMPDDKVARLLDDTSQPAQRKARRGGLTK